MKRIKILYALLAAGALGLGGQHVGAQQLGTKKTLNLAIAKQIALASEKECVKNGWMMFITIIDDGGTVLFLERVDDAQIGSYEVSIEKAQTALKFRRPSKTFEDLANSGRPAVLRLPGALPAEGGIPLMADGKVIGAIGVSGGSGQQDAQVAQAGVAALEAIVRSGR